MESSTILKLLSGIVTYFVPVSALILSIISLFKSSKGQKLQDRVNELEIRIKQYELTELDRKKSEASMACVEARVINISRGNYRLKVWNSGKARALNVTASVDKNANLIFIDSKMPFDFLDGGKNFEVHLIVHSGTADKFKIITNWEDEAGQQHQKEQMGSL